MLSKQQSEHRNRAWFHGHGFAKEMETIKMNARGVFRGGTSGLVFQEKNKKEFPVAYQDKSRLTYYASLFNSIEINSSFYKIPRCRTYANWCEMVPDEFQFTIKLWKGITHQVNSDFRVDELEKFMTAIDCLSDHKGCLLIQFPAGFTSPSDKLIHILELVSRMDSDMSWRLAVEFRHTGWYNPSIYQILDQFNASLVIHDMPKSKPEAADQKSSFKYFRFHGELGDYRGTYSDSFLSSKAKMIQTWLDKGTDVYAYFNNTIGDAVKNLKTLNQMVNH
jgi:uncharacterized protein YecE (DUF72 family)